MALELSCGQCGWRLLGTEATAPVACPQCGGLLSALKPEPPSWIKAAEAAESAAAHDSGDFSYLTASGVPVPDGDTALLLEVSDAPEPSSKTTVYDTPVPPPGGVVAFGPPAHEGFDTPGSGDTPPDVAIPLSVVASLSALPAEAAPMVGSDPLVAAAATPTNAPPRGIRPASPGPSTFAFRLALSYASAVTLVCLYLIYLLSRHDSRLDLPDLGPPHQDKNRVAKLLYLEPEAARPPSHVLGLNESQRFGSVKVTPLRVTRGPMQFDYFDSRADETRAPSEPVLKLHLRLENASTDQEFMPLDRQLVFTKEPDSRNFGQFKANTLLFADSERSDHARHVLVYDLSPDSPWLIRGENLDRELGPGESVEAFIPTTEEGWETLSGPLVWRVHLRKGYNRRTLRGVTTLIEIRFASSEIVDEQPAAAEEA